MSKTILKTMAVVASADAQTVNSFVHAETFIAPGETTDFSFAENNMNFGQTFSKGLLKKYQAQKI